MRATVAAWLATGGTVRSFETVLHAAGMALFGGAAIAGRGTLRWLERRRHPERGSLATLIGRETPAVSPRSAGTALGRTLEANEERSLDCNLAVSIAATGLAAGGALVYPPLRVLSAPLTIYASLDLFADAWRGLASEGRVRASMLDGIAVLGALAFGYYFASALTNSLYFGGLGLVRRTRERSSRTLPQGIELSAQTAWVLRNGGEIETPLEFLEAGQRVVIRAGEIVPVDGLIVSGSAGLDQRLLTGESSPAEKSTGDRVLAATLVLSGRIEVLAEDCGQATVAARIDDILRRTVDYRPEIELRSQELSNRLALPTLGLGGATWLLLGLPSATALINANFSDILRIASPLALLNYLQGAMRRGILVKDGRSFERLADVDTVVFDKTGTLTQDRPVVEQVHVLGERDEDEVLTLAASAEAHQCHPVAEAIRDLARARGLDWPDSQDPCCELGFGIRARCRDMTVLVGSSRFLSAQGIDIPAAAEAIREQSEGLGHSLVFVAVDGRLEGLLELHSVPRPEAAATVQALQARGLDVCLISGDREAPTRRLAESLGIRRYRAEALPADKFEYVDGLVGAGRTVCFVGDGINDLPAMRRASIAISIGGATTAAVSAAEVVLLDKTLAQLAPLFGLAEELRGNLHRSAQVTLGPGLVCAAGVLLFHWGILATLVAYNAALVAGLTNAMLPALKEGTERRTASFSPSSTSQAHGRGRSPGSTVRPDPTPDISNDRSLIGPGHDGRT
ncbi:MAG: heavy metal translocating P-type ATPase [Methylococcus sp.]